MRTVPLNNILASRLRFHLERTERGHKLFVPDGKQTHEAIKKLQAFICSNRERVQDSNYHRPMTFHGLRHTRAVEWYQGFIQKGKNPCDARRVVAKLLGHGRDDVARVYLASLKGGGHG